MTSLPVCDSSPAEQHEAVPRMPARVQVLLAGANGACWLAIIPLYQVLLPLQVTALDTRGKVADLALITSLAGITAILAQLLTGTLSDRTTTRWGRRKPWMIGGTALTMVALLALAWAPNLVVLTIALAGFGLSMNMLLCALLAIIPDRVPISQRASVSAVVGMAQPLGTLIGILLIAQFRSLLASYSTIALILGIAVLAFVLRVPEPAVSREVLPPFSWSRLLLGFLKPLGQRDFRWAWLARFCTITAQTVLATYILFYIEDAHLLPATASAAGVGIFQMVQTVSLIVTSLVAGKLSDHIQRRKVFVLLAGAMMTVAFLLLAGVPSWPMVLVSSALFGAGFGIFIAGDLAMSTQVLPDAQSQGRDLGVITAGTILPELLFPLIAWLAFQVLGGYPALFCICAAACVLGALCILPIKHVR